MNAQIEIKRENLNKRKSKLRQLEELEQNLNSYVELAYKFIKNEDNVSYVHNVEDLENLVDSIKSIEGSIEISMKHINEINNDLSLDCAYIDKVLSIETNVLKPLAVHWSHLSQFMEKWKVFNQDLNALKIFLKAC